MAEQKGGVRMPQSVPTRLDIAGQIPGLQTIVLQTDVAELLEPLATHSPFKFNHSLRSGLIARDVHTVLGSSEETQLRALKVGLKHDAFQVVEHDEATNSLVVVEKKLEVIHSPGQRTPESWAVIRMHPEEAAEYVGRVQGFFHEGRVIRAHHGFQGDFSYPEAINPDEINPQELREFAIFAAGDVTDSLVNMDQRPYTSWKIVDGKEVLTGDEWTPSRVRRELRDKFGKYLTRDERDAILDAGLVYRGMVVEDFISAAA